MSGMVGAQWGDQPALHPGYAGYAGYAVYSAAGPGVSGVRDDAALLDALVRQKIQLDVLVARLERGIVDHLRNVDETLWEGPARLAHDVAVDSLRSTLRGVVANLRLARVETATAVATVRGRG